MNQYKLYTHYSSAVGKFGPDSAEAQEIRDQHRDDPEFLRFATAVDRLKRRIQVAQDAEHQSPGAPCTPAEPVRAAAASV